MRRRLKERNGEQKRQRLVHFAHKHLGRPYRYGARRREVPRAFDCSAFTQYLYRRVGIELPRTALEQAHGGQRVAEPLRRNLSVGDLLFFTGSWGRYDPEFPAGIGHVAMVLSDREVVHAKYRQRADGSNGGNVRIDPLNRWLTRGDLVVAKRYL